MKPHEHMIQVTMQDPEVAPQIRALNCILSPVTKQVMDDMVAKFFFDCGSSIESFEYKVSTGWKPGTLVVEVQHTGGDELYDWIMNQKETAIGDDIWYWANKQMVFVSHDVELTMRFSVHCPLPEDDFKTLDMLGKVHREYKPGKMETSIFCEA